MFMLHMVFEPLCALCWRKGKQKICASYCTDVVNKTWYTLLAVVRWRQFTVDVLGGSL